MGSPQRRLEPEVRCVAIIGTNYGPSDRRQCMWRRADGPYCNYHAKRLRPLNGVMNIGLDA